MVDRGASAGTPFSLLEEAVAGTDGASLPSVKSRRIAFTVLGVAMPKGSTRAFMPKGAKFPVVVHDNKPSLKGWENSIRAAIQQYAGGTFFDGPVLVRIAFYLPRPKSLSRKVVWHTKKPDLDKLARGSLDAMKGVLWGDDSQVVQLQVTKHYAADQPQAVIEIEEA